MSREGYNARMRRIEGLIVLGAAVLVWVGTPWGLGLSRDSSVYFDAARNLAFAHRCAVTIPGGGFLPLTHFPPLYPALLSLGASWGLPLFTYARALAVFLIAAQLLLYMVVVRRETSPRWTPWIFALVWLSHPISWRVHTMAWSEPLAMFLGFLGGWFWSTEGHSLTLPRWITAVFLVSLSCLTRYASLGFGASLLICGSEGSGRMFGKEAGRRSAGVLIGGLPLLAWAGRNAFVTGGVTDRAFRFHVELLVPALREFAHTVSSWVFPQVLQRPGAWLAPFLVLAVFLWPTTETSPWRKFLRIFALSYFALITLTIAFFDADTPMDGRILFPLQTAFYLFALIRFAPWLERHWKLALSLLLVWGMLQGRDFADAFRQTHQDAPQYAARRWQTSDLLARLRTQPPAVLYSNVPEVVSLYTSGAAYMLPDPADSSEMFQRVREGKAYLAIFSAPGWPLAAIDERLTRHDRLKRLIQAADGTVYGV